LTSLKNKYFVGFSLLSGIMLFAAWPVSPLSFLIFLGFSPLLFIAENSTRKIIFFWYCFAAIFIWNIGSTWWIWNSTDVGSIAAIIANSLLMCLPWLGFFSIQQKQGKQLGYFSLVVFWMLFEYIHLNWQLSWPWLTLGNVFATHPNWIQWYEYTGVSGGTLWILLSNILLYELIQAFRLGSALKKTIVLLALTIITPLIISYFISQKLANKKPSTTTTNLIIVQPNIDPNGKFNQNNAAAQIQLLIDLSEKQIDSSTRLIIWPETAMSVAELQNNVPQNLYYQPIFQFLYRHPSVTLLSGIETYKNYQNIKATNTARKTPDGNYYDAFNASVYIKMNEDLQFYNKGKLVPGVETLPSFLNFMGPVFEKFGGTAGGYGKSDSSSVFKVKDNPYVAAPIICYESIYGEYVASYVAKGANVLCVITNDGWWGNTPGHKQHVAYASLRAIETRRWVARSANTGISAVIDPAGNILETRAWDTPAMIKYAIPTSAELSFYVQYGDWLYKIAAILALVFIGWRGYSIIRMKISGGNK